MSRVSETVAPQLITSAETARALPAEQEKALESFSILPTLKGVPRAVEFLHDSGIRVSRYAVYSAARSGQLEYVYIADAFYFSERGLMRWIFSQTKTHASS